VEGAIPPAGDDDDTVIVGGQDDDPTVLVSREETVRVSRDETVLVPSEETVLVPSDETVRVVREPAEPDDEDTLSMSTDRGASPPSALPTTAGDGVDGVDDAEDHDDTVIIGDENAIAASAAEPAAAEASVGGDAEVTIRVERSDSGLPTVRVTRSASSAVRPAMVPQPARRRGELRPAPVPSGFGGVPLVASGAGAVSSYRARTLAPPSAALAAPSPASSPDRVLSGVASVRAQSRRVSRWTLTAAAASVVLIAGGMLWAIKDLVGF